ncbi:JAB domain-containing protein [Vagococcus xieshaowenii]|uniref:DNA repair protein RadC n=1 Tax=Vagococcus xieshaowenii TaxID=2562451 RepID=A0A4Z0D1H9_9ENTE|nr:JAB domain-containing protein [Vagococcus xieshaowenii]QCA29473.1 DNA repair protein RadC [Vagococcus xieshaowenii]TFZ39601.1 DNA repair protein RadC [Vagococcus xieshaowenii]
MKDKTIICEEIISLKQVKRKRQSKLLPEKVTSSFSIAHWLTRHIGSQTQEYLVLICLNTKNEIINYSTVCIGTLNQSLAHPRDLLQRALLCNSANIIISHNHPSGISTPSSADEKFTKRLKEACEIVGISLLDHIIVTDNKDYYSFREVQPDCLN